MTVISDDFIKFKL